MEQIITTLLNSSGGQFAIVLACILTLFWLVHYATKFITAIQTEHNLFKETVDKNQNNTENIQRDVSYIKGNIDFLMKHFSDGLASHNSPLALTADGKELVENEKLDKIIDNNWVKIYNLLSEKSNINSEYDIQQFCYEYLMAFPEKFINDEDLTYIKKNSFEKGIPIMSYNRLLTIIIRDRLFKK